MTEGGPELQEKIEAILRDMHDEYVQRHDKPWIVGLSGGKDSTLVAQLAWEMLLEMPPSKRRRVIHMVSNDTLVESPVVQTFVDGLLEKMGQAAEATEVPVLVKKTLPEMQNRFWCVVIGLGYPMPSRLFRWCTDRMKIRPTSGYIRGLAEQKGAILLLGVRRSESAARSQSVARYDNGERLNAHGSIQNVWVYRPIVELSTEEVWTTLLQRRPPWGGTHRPLVTLYRNAMGGECPFVVDEEDAPSCGENPSSRFGCWTCTVVEKDRSMEGFVANGFEHLEPLVEFRDWLKQLTADRSKRLGERRNGEDGLGPFSMEARVEILAKLREVEKETGLALVSEEEEKFIRQVWQDDKLERSMRVLNQVRESKGQELIEVPLLTRKARKS